MTLAVFGGASAVIAGGILAASAATAEPTKAPSGRVAVVGAITVAASTPPPAIRLPEGSESGAERLSTTPKFYGTQQESDRALRASMITRFDPEDDSWINTVPPQDTVIAVGPTPCDSCDPLDLDNPLSPNYDPTILAVYQEDDLLAPPEGPGFATCGGLSATGPFWAGANDHCWLQNIPGENVDNIEHQIPALTSTGQRYEICGQIGLINTSGFTGDPNYPGGLLRTEDVDVWEVVMPAGNEIKITGYAGAANLRRAMTFNGGAFGDGLGYGQFRDCNDDYYTHADSYEWVSSTSAPCDDFAVFDRYMQPGYYYLLMEPLSTAPQGVPGAQLCEYWYTLVIEVPDPEGACCVGEACTDDVAKTVCFGLGGVFRGRNASCTFAVCCDPLAELAGEGLTADYTEGDAGFNTFTEERCNIVGSADINPGCQRDAQGNPIPGFPDAGEAVQNSSGVLLDVCADPDKFVIIGYSGTPDDYEASFFASQFFVLADGDAFVFENSSGASQSLSFDGFSAATGVWQLQVNAGSSPDAGAFGYNCDISGFLNAGGISPPCERISVSDCVPDETTWSFGFRNYEAMGISCDTPYWFSIDCAPCPKVACCLPNGSCVDGLDEMECDNFLDPGAAGGVPGASWSSCCYISCPDACGGEGIPSGSVADDTCTTVNPNTGDLFNSGCDAPDGNPIGKFSTIGFPAQQAWCGSTGTYVLTLPSENPTLLNSEADYYLIDLSAASNDVGLKISITPAAAITMYAVPDRGPSNCPTTGLDGTSNVRELDDTQAFTLNGGVTSIVDLCLETGMQHILLFETSDVVECGAPYNVEVTYFTDGCKAACCNSYLNQNGLGAQGCTLVADVPGTIPNEALQTCSSDNVRGTYRGMNTRCTGSGAVTCCTVAQVGGDLSDADNGVCPATNASNPNRGCISPAGGSFQALGNFTPGVGPDPGTSVTVWGTVCRQSIPQANPITDNDFYSVNVNNAGGAEYLCTVETNARIAVNAYNAPDLGLPTSCNIPNPAREILFNPTIACSGPVTVAASGLSNEGSSFCLLGNQLNYFLVQPTVINDGVEAQYRMTLTAYECRVGACCLDAALCFDDAGFLECEAVSGGQFIAGASCPDDNAGLLLCRGVCCVDAGPGPPVCVPNVTAYDCCVLLNGGSFPFDSRFAGYSAGDHVLDIDCVNNPDICEEGACCVDSVSGYTCQDNLSDVECSSLSGLFQGIGTQCADVTCPVHPCCVGPQCAEGYSPLECSTVGGVYKPLDASCATVACVPSGACCFTCAGTVTPPCPDPSGPVVNCTILTAAQCLAARGVYVGNNTTCIQGIGGPCDCGGDINGDGNCNTADFNTLAGQFGLGNPNCRTRAQGDLNCDGIVNTADFNIVAGSFGCIRN